MAVGVQIEICDGLTDLSVSRDDGQEVLLVFGVSRCRVLRSRTAEAPISGLFSDNHQMQRPSTMTRQVGVILIGWLLIARPVIGNTHDNAVNKCNLPTGLVQEIESYAPKVTKIINETLFGTFKGSTYDDLGTFVDKFGARFSGTQNLENAIDYVLNKSIDLGFENVHGEPVQLPHWIRGLESATLLRPRLKDIAMLGLGYSVGTPEEGITAEAIVVDSFEELQKNAHKVRGKIVVYNQKFVSYGQSVQYRSKGATKAAELGAVGALVRSVTPYSLYTPHTGMQTYGPNVTKIPVACITVEDAELLRRMYLRGQVIEINMKMQAKFLPDVESRNIVAEIQGSTNPEKVVVVSGHVDSWDVGQGAVDDGGGAFISFKALHVLRHLNMRPRRTVRLIMWTGEEMGIIGARHYINAHAAENDNMQFVMESDMGTFMPLGLQATGTDEVICVLEKVLSLMPSIGPLGVSQPNEGPDIAYWVDQGIPGGSLWTKNEKYFNYHHTNADTMTVEDPDALDRGTAIFAAVSYVLADLSYNLPRHR